MERTSTFSQNEAVLQWRKIRERRDHAFYIRSFNLNFILMGLQVGQRECRFGRLHASRQPADHLHRRGAPEQRKVSASPMQFFVS